MRTENELMEIAKRIFPAYPIKKIEIAKSLNSVFYRVSITVMGVSVSDVSQMQSRARENGLYLNCIFPSTELRTLEFSFYDL